MTSIQKESIVCRVSGKKLQQTLDLGMQPLGNGFLSEKEFKKEYFYPMATGFCPESKMFQLLEQPDPGKMFHDQYAFYSSSSRHMQSHFKKFADAVLESRYLATADPFVVELGCNDGILIQNFASRGIRHLGVEPSRNVAAEAQKKGVRTVSDFFGEELAGEIFKTDGPADIFLAANVMCHIPDILGVARGIHNLLKPGGLLMFEDPYLGAMVEKTSYDQIYDEHVFLFSAHSVQTLFAKVGMELVDLLPQSTHGGSMRYVLANKGVMKPSPAVRQIMMKETLQGLDQEEGFSGFRKKVEKSKNDLVVLLKDLKKQGKKVAGYAATSKSTTILNYCKIGPDLVDYICDTTPIKQGKFSPGMHIPIQPYEYFQKNPPDYAILFAWNHSEEIMAKEKEYMAQGGRWITHVPEVRVIA
jgi:methylation protein EvaC